MRAEAAGEQAVAVGDVHPVAGPAAGGPDRPGHHRRPGRDVLGGVADDGGPAGRAGRRVHPGDLLARDREHAERVVVAQVRLGGEREARPGRPAPGSRPGARRPRRTRPGSAARCRRRAAATTAAGRAAAPAARRPTPARSGRGWPGPVSGPASVQAVTRAAAVTTGRAQRDSADPSLPLDPDDLDRAHGQDLERADGLAGIRGPTGRPSYRTRCTTASAAATCSGSGRPPGQLDRSARPSSRTEASGGRANREPASAASSAANAASDLGRERRTPGQGSRPPGPARRTRRKTAAVRTAAASRSVPIRSACARRNAHALAAPAGRRPRVAPAVGSVQTHWSRRPRPAPTRARRCRAGSARHPAVCHRRTR